MIFDVENTQTLAPPVGAALPTGLAWSERAAMALRAYLNAADLGHYRIYFCTNLDLGDIDTHVAALEGSHVDWEPPAASIGGGEPLMAMWRPRGSSATGCESGFLRLARHDAVLARWYWINESGELQSTRLIAVPTPAHYGRLHETVTQLRRARGESVWQIFRDGYNDPVQQPRKPDVGAKLVIAAPVLQRVETEIIGFFSDAVAKMHRALGVPYRRGVLLIGPPGNGKTSLIRSIGATLSKIPAMILRPATNFDTDDLEEILRKWTSLAPAMLVLEDLDHLLQSVNVSTFLNLIDGVEASATDGLMVIASTNHPEQLDPAINNRPGRFDVVLEIAPPDRPLRTRYLADRLADAPAATIEKLVKLTDGLSFAHLEEILRLSGFRAIQHGRDVRTDDDLINAAEIVRSTNEEAARGHPPKPDAPFGLAALRQSRDA